MYVVALIFAAIGMVAAIEGKDKCLLTGRN